MIFVTVGGQLPFDRLVRVVDHWAGEHGRSDVFAQIGDGEALPKHFPYARFLSPSAFRERLAEASVVVAHAGIGTMVSCLEAGIPIVVLPRRADLGEQRNDHQLATAKRFRERGQVRVAMDEEELLAVLEAVDELGAGGAIGSRASDELLEAIRSFVAS